VILATFRELARALGCQEDQAPDVMRSAASARATLSRRALLGALATAAGAVETGASFSFAAPAPAGSYQTIEFYLNGIFKRSYRVWMPHTTVWFARSVRFEEPAIGTGIAAAEPSVQKRFSNDRPLL
jgi:hypothetical protein